MRLYVDIDGVLIDTVRIICKMYSEDYCFTEGFEYIDPKNINTWDFEELSLASKEKIDSYFEENRFFYKAKNLASIQKNLCHLENLSKICNVVFVSMGTQRNLELKEKFLQNIIKNFKYDFIKVDIKNKDKSCVDMSDGILVDDSYSNLSTTNAKVSICFGNRYSWNEQWEGKVCANWGSLYRYLSWFIRNDKRIFDKNCIVKHFKYETLSEEDKQKRLYTYRYIDTCVHSETKEKMVVYSALYSGMGVNFGDVFVRPYDMFMGEVDKEKYPNIKQKYRFERESDHEDN